MKKTLEWYAVGQAPPPPGNVKGKEVQLGDAAEWQVKYRLVHLTFGPNSSLSLDIGIYTPVDNNHVPTLISPSGTPPGATPLPRLAQGVNQGQNEDVLLVTGPAAPAAGWFWRSAACASRGRAIGAGGAGPELGWRQARHRAAGPASGSRGWRARDRRPDPE